MTDVSDVLSRSAVRDIDITAFTALRSTPQPITVEIMTTPVFRTRARAGTITNVRNALATYREYVVERPVGAVHPATAAVNDLRSWLNLPLDTLVACVGLSPSVRQFWRQYPESSVRDKTGRLLRLHTAVGLLVGAVGADHARSALSSEGWLAQPLDDSRLVQLEARIRGILRPGPLTMPAHLAGGLTAELLAQVSDPAGDLAQQHDERARRTDSFGPEEPG